jgi:hypothetical protein
MLLHSRAAAAKAKKLSVRIREMPLALQIITIHHDDPEGAAPRGPLAAPRGPQALRRRPQGRRHTWMRSSAIDQMHRGLRRQACKSCLCLSRIVASACSQDLCAARNREDHHRGTIAHRCTSSQLACLATVLEVLLRAGFVASMPGTPEFCPRKDTPQVVHCDDGRISTRGKRLPIFSH